MSALAKESGHFYYNQPGEWGPAGAPCYEITGKNGKVRQANLGDLKRGLPIDPGYSTIERLVAKPGLQIWKDQQLLKAARIVKQNDGESEKDHDARILFESKEIGRKAVERGIALHAALDEYGATGQFSLEWQEHINAVSKELAGYGIDITNGRVEHSFVSPLGYGGKVDWHDDTPIVLDYKNKESIEDEKQLAYDEHAMQLGAYGHGLFGEQQFRAMNVFVGVEDKKVVVVEHSWDDLQRGWAMFLALLNYWRVKARLM